MDDKQRKEFEEWWSERMDFSARLPGETEDERVRRIAFRAYEAGIESAE